jgi:hypothetical protein
LVCSSERHHRAPHLPGEVDHIVVGIVQRIGSEDPDEVVDVLVVGLQRTGDGLGSDRSGMLMLSVIGSLPG